MKKNPIHHEMVGQPLSVEMLPLDALLVDHSYQRKEVSESNTADLARRFSIQTAGALYVGLRVDGKFYVVDGQQRLIAMRKRGDIKKALCHVFLSRGPAHEAEEFRRTNTNRRPVSALYKFNADVMAGVEPETAIAKWLESARLRVVHEGSSLRAVSFISAFIQLWRRNIEASQAAIVTQLAICVDSPLNVDIHKGLWVLENNGIKTDPHIKKIVESGGKTALLRAIKAKKIELGKAGERVSALGLLDIINKGRRGGRISLSAE